MRALRPVTRAAARALNLKSYTPTEFRRWHDAGAGVITASGVPALLGVSKWESRYSYLHRVRTADAVERPVTPVMVRGRLLETIAAELIAMQRSDLVVMAGNYVAEHPTITRFLATPDVIVRRRAGTAPDYGVGEIKTVGKGTFETAWEDGPPLHVEWQHHAQMVATGARWGIIAALLISEFPPIGELPFELVIYEREFDATIGAEVEATVREALTAVDSGELGTPDPSPHTTRVLRAMHRIDPNAIAHLVENQEAASIFDAWVAAQRGAKEARSAIEAAKDYFTALAPEASLFLLPGGRRITLKEIHRKAYTVAESTQVRWSLDTTSA